MKSWEWGTLNADKAEVGRRLEAMATPPYASLGLGPRGAWTRTEWLDGAAVEPPRQRFILAGDEPGSAGFTQFQASPWDTAILGRPVWRITVFQAWLPEAVGTLLRAINDSVPTDAYVFGRTAATTPGLESGLRAHGFRVVERLRAFGIASADWASPTQRLALEPLGVSDLPWAQDVAQRARNEEDRYHADPAVAPKADAFMRQWVQDGMAGFCDHAFKVKVQGRAAGIALWQGAKAVAPGLLSPAKLVLGAVDPDLQGHGAYTALTVGGAASMIQAGARHLLMTTQSGNLGAVKAWTNAGLRPLDDTVTFSRA